MSASADRACKILFFHPYFSDGGVERTNIGLARELIRGGFEVAFLTIKPSPHFLDEVAAAGIEFVVLEGSSTLVAQPALCRWIRAEKKRSLGQNRRLVVIGCQYYVNVCCALFRPFWGKGVNLIFSERNHLSEFDNRSGIKARLVAAAVKAIYRYADCVVANSRELANDLAETTGCSVELVYNPTVNDRLYALAQEPVVEPWFMASTLPTIVGVGRLSFQKDFDLLIRAFALLRREMSSRLLILGEGDERGSLERRIHELGLDNDVVMPGFVSNPYKFIKKASLFVLSSKYEGLPNVLIESIALGVPAVSLACKSGPTEILLEGKGGWLVRERTAEALAAAMRNALGNPGEASRRTEYAALALERFSPEQAGQGIVSVITKVCGSA